MRYFVVQALRSVCKDIHFEVRYIQVISIEQIFIHIDFSVRTYGQALSCFEILYKTVNYVRLKLTQSLLL